MLFPPQWTVVAPSIGIPILNAQLKKNGFKTKISDLNIEFFNDILTAENLTLMLEKSEKELSDLTEIIIKNDYNLDKITSYSLEIQAILHKYSCIKNYFDKKSSPSYAIKNIEEAKKTYREEDKFYNSQKLLKAQKIIESALEIALLPYSPTRMYLDRYYNPLLKLEYENIKFHCFDKNSNIFLDYYPPKIKSLVNKDTKLITISINSETQIIPGLTLGYLLKKETSAHISIGGDYFRRIISTFQKKPEFFDLFCDSIMIEDAEASIVELANYINAKIDIADVSGLIYKNSKNEVVINPAKIPPELDQIETITLDGFDLSQYFSPKIVLPLKSNRHCSWGKCVFCDLYYGQHYCEKSPKKLILEIKEIINKYGITNFEFIDSSISPSYLEKFAELLLKENIKINYYSFARLENGFTKEVLKKASKSGLKMLLWGVESGSERIIKLMNKGVDFKNRLKILKDSNNANIWNYIFTMMGFPTETMDEAMETIKFATQNVEIMHPVQPSMFRLKKHSKIIENPEEYGITKFYETDEDFSQKYAIESNSLTKDEIRELLTIYQETYLKNLGIKNPLWLLIESREHFLLYLSKFGNKKILKNQL